MDTDMKLVLSLQPQDIPVDYTNLYGVDAYGLGEITQSSCRHIDAGQIYDYLDHNQRIEVMKNMLSKIRKNGTVIMRGVCPREFSRLVYLGQLTNPELSEGIKDRASLVTTGEIRALFEQYNIQVIRADISGYTWVIEGQRTK